MSEYRDDIESVIETVRTDQANFEPPVEIPDEAAAIEYLRRGAGQAVAIYIDGRTDGLAPFDEDEFDMLEEAVNTSFKLYAACFGEDIEPSVTIRAAAELVVSTHSIREAAALLTDVPERPGTAWTA